MTRPSGSEGGREPADGAGERVDRPGDVLSDPRVDAEHVRAFAGTDGDPLVLVGCVHDHPASAYRARRVVEALEPAVVAVELPRLALPFFDPTAGSTSPAGGEFRAALSAAAAVDARTAAVDALGPRFVRSLWRELGDGDPSRATLRRIGSAASSVFLHAASCRMAALLGDRWPLDPGRAARNEYDLPADAPPARQADHERRRLSASRSVLRALERPLADEIVDATRERTMAANLERRTAAGGTVAVVGFDHLSGIADRLDDRGFERRSVDPAALNELWA